MLPCHIWAAALVRFAQRPHMVEEYGIQKLTDIQPGAWLSYFNDLHGSRLQNTVRMTATRTMNTLRSTWYKSQESAKNSRMSQQAIMRAPPAK
jgi:hypothetical protein